jgi:hypothetical protein
VWACVDALHAHDAFRIVELFPRQVEYADLHRAFDLAVWALGAFYGISFDSGEAILLKNRHQCSSWANISAPKPWNVPGGPEETNENQYSQGEKRGSGK